jgi:peptidyl-prolyl cis-trans isomerase D
MLQAINDRIKGWLGGVVIALISLPFALWGISSYFSGGEAPNAATVDGVKISVQELDNSVTRQKQELRKRFGDQLPFADSMIKQQVLDQLVNQKVLEGYTHDQGYRVSDLQLFSTIKSLFSQNGEFDRAVFENLVRSRGMTIPQFEDELRSEIRVSQFGNGLRSTAIVTDAELEHFAKLEAQQREISLLKFSVDNYIADVKISDADVQAAYDMRPDQFMTPEQVSVEYIELTGDRLAKDIKLDEQKVQRAYDSYVAQVSLNEQRKASHILIKPVPDRTAAMVKLEQVKKLLAEGKSFASLAKEYSDDNGSAANGGDLDWVEHGQLVQPFEDALFGLAETGDVSDVVETQFGLHLIKLDDIRKQKPLSLAEKRKDIEADLKREIVSGMFYDQSELLATTSYENPDSLDAAAADVELPVKKSELMTQSAGKGIAIDPKIREAAFSNSVLVDNLNSDVIELAPDHVVVLRVHEHVPASKLPLEQVRASIIRHLQGVRALALTTEKARSARDEILTGKAASSFVARGIRLDKPLLVKRSDADKVNPAALRLAFEMTKPEAGKVSAADVALGNSDVAVVILHKVITPDKIEQSQLDTLRRRRMSDIAISEYKAAVEYISAGYDINKNPKALE